MNTEKDLRSAKELLAMSYGALLASKKEDDNLDFLIEMIEEFLFKDEAKDEQRTD